MSTVEEGFTYLFYGATILALVFFIHKVLWLVAYKRIQSALVHDAVARLLQGNEATLAAWEELATRCWANALGEAEIKNATTFLLRVDEGLDRLRADMKARPSSIEELLIKALSTKGSAAPTRATVLSIRRLTGRERDECLTVEMDLCFPAVALPRPPDKRL